MADQSNIREFEIALGHFAEDEVPERVREITDAIASDALRLVVHATPVRSGRLRGNWQTTVGEPATGFDADRTDEDGGPTIDAGLDVITADRDPYASIWLHNGVPYGVFVNDGTERMAGQHMVENTVEHMQRFADRLRGRGGG